MSPPRSIGFLLHPGERATVQSAIARAQACGFTAWTALDDPEAAIVEHGENTALLVTLGGDGTFLYGARLAAPRGIPVVGVNRGRLGFLTDVEIGALPEAIIRFAAGDYTTQRRSLLATTVGAAAEVVLALNEIVVRARDVNVVRLRVDVDGDLLGAFDADGVVVLPPALAAQVLADAQEQERQEEFIAGQVAQGESIDGLYPLSGRTRPAYQAWVRGQGDAG